MLFNLFLGLRMKFSAGRKINKRTYEAYINGDLVGKAYGIDPTRKRAGGIEVAQNSVEKILSYSVQEISTIIDSLAIPVEYENVLDIDFLKKPISLSVMLSRDTTKLPLIEYSYVSIVPDLMNWNRQFTYSQILSHFEKEIENDPYLNFYKSEEVQGIVDFGIIFESAYLEKDLRSLYLDVKRIVNQALDNTFRQLVSEDEGHSLTSVFNFPQDIRIACEQYLLYFARFLSDIGIEVKTSVNAQTEQTLFSVTPENSDQALSIIRDALNIYLELPGITELEVFSKDHTDIGVQQLISNVFHLKSQLQLANSIIQAKEATIKSMSFTNYQQQKALESLEEKVKNEEPTLDGLVTINEFEGKGFKINLPELFRRIRRKIKDT